MRLFLNIFMVFAVVFICLCSTAMAQQSYAERFAPITKTQANDFYEECLKQPHPTPTAASKELFCSCSSARFFKQLRQGDISDLRVPTSAAGRLAKEKLLEYVYIPCVRDSHNDLVVEECEYNTALDEYEYLDKPAYCACMGHRMKFVFEETFGQVSDENKLNLDASLANPLGAFMENGSYQNKSAKVTDVCFRQSTIKYKAPKPPPRGPIGTMVTAETDTETAVVVAATEKETKPEVTAIPLPIPPKETKKAAPPPTPQKEGPQCRKMDYDEAYKPENLRRQYNQEGQENQNG